MEANLTPERIGAGARAMTRAQTPAGVIHAVAGQEPERALVAAIVRQAVDDARAGDAEARAWLAGPACLRWLAWLTPDHADPAAVQAQLVADVDAALARRRTTNGARQTRRAQRRDAANRGGTTRRPAGTTAPARDARQGGGYHAHHEQRCARAAAAHRGRRWPELSGQEGEGEGAGEILKTLFL